MKHVSAPPAAVVNLPSAASTPAVRPRKSERNLSHTLLFACNVVAALLLLTCLLLLYVWPDRIARLHMTVQTTQILTLNLVSLLLLVAWLQRNLTGAWRALTVGAAFVVLAESWLVGLT